jgi:hypothetical protein
MLPREVVLKIRIAVHGASREREREQERREDCKQCQLKSIVSSACEQNIA